MTRQPLQFPMPDDPEPQRDISLVGLLDAIKETNHELAKLREIKEPPAPTNGKFSWRRVGEGVAVVLVAALIIWAMGIHARVGTLELEHFTKVEAGAMESRIKDEIRQTERDLLEALPPEWLLDRLDAMDARLGRLERARGVGDGGTTGGGA